VRAGRLSGQELQEFSNVGNELSVGLICWEKTRSPGKITRIAASGSSTDYSCWFVALPSTSVSMQF
jgi:hypothetical protein